MVALPDAPTDADLIRRWQDERDEDAAAELCERFRPLVYSVARRYVKSFVPLEDLRQIAYVAFIEAVNRFDAKRGFTLTALAVPYMAGAIQNWLRDHHGLVKMPRRLRRVRIQVSKAIDVLSQSGRPTIDQIAEYTDMDRATVEQALVSKDGMDGEILSLNQPAKSLMQGEFVGIEDLSNYTGALDAELERVESDIAIRQLMDSLSRDLDERDKTILQMRVFEGRSQRVISEAIGISQMHVSRLERALYARLRAMWLQE